MVRVAIGSGVGKGTYQGAASDASSGRQRAPIAATQSSVGSVNVSLVPMRAVYGNMLG